ncbi:hypothetical protein Indivirus_3_74 [Indivirus ILV1]|uniref:NET domain-containing protein n=1 Tax=Indivirus ILV1 TaxID=1977633 RepID=A0A1V0SDP1_9VIRU|nr:hypothetical protein Indivirus_3_74 [Indivirus ILV1]
MEYPYEKKKRLAKKISTLKRKEDMVKILEIIYADNKNITENQNGLFMFFDKLNDSTYHKIDSYLKSTTKKKTDETEKNKFVTYSKNEFSDTVLKTTSDTPKVKYSNKEKNIIKRQRYSEQLQSENNSDKNVRYAKFDLTLLSDSENKKEEITTPSTTEITISSDPQTAKSSKSKKTTGRPKRNVVVA